MVANPSHPFELIRIQRSKVDRPEGLPHLVQTLRPRHAYIDGPSYHRSTVPPRPDPSHQNFPAEIRRLEKIGTEFAERNG